MVGTSEREGGSREEKGYHLEFLLVNEEFEGQESKVSLEFRERLGLTGGGLRQGRNLSVNLH